MPTKTKTDSKKTAKKKSGTNCGIGPGGFKPGNTCAKEGSKSSESQTGYKLFAPFNLGWKKVQSFVNLSHDAARILKDAPTSHSIAVKNWMGTESGRMRAEIAKGKPSKQTNDFLNALNKLPTYSGTVYRGLGNRHGEVEFLVNAKPGTVFMDKAPSSTTIDHPIAATFARGSIFLPPNSRGKVYPTKTPLGVLLRIKQKPAKVLPHDGMIEEYEAVLPPETKLRVKHVHRNAVVSFRTDGKSRQAYQAVVDLEEI